MMDDFRIGNDEDSEDEFTDSEFESESESEACDLEYSNVDPNYGFDASFMETILKTLQTNSEVNYKNCLELNKHMQQQLAVIREHLQLLLERVAKRYKDNEAALKNNQSIRSQITSSKGAYLRGGAFYFKGNMFFRDIRNRCGPNNPDYIRRSTFEGEMFPMDFDLRSRHVWSVMDKVTVVQAIKEQIIGYLNDRSKRQVLLPYLEKIKDKVIAHTETLVALLAKVNDDFVIDWSEISAHNLKSRHSPTSCNAMWNVYLKPTLRRSDWTDDENCRLVNAVQQCKYQDWQGIAKLVGHRSDYQCFVQFETTAFQLVPQETWKWDAELDQKLLNLIEESKVNGLIRWNKVMIHFPNKSKATIQQRYLYSLNPNIVHTQFTPEEDLILLAAVQEYGTTFSSFPRTLFPNRSTVQLRSRYRNILENRHTQTPWSVDDDKKLIDFVSEHGISDWRRCAELLGNHNRTSCRTRFLTIKKFLEQNPTMSVTDIPRRKVRKTGSSVSKKNWFQKITELRKDPSAEFTVKQSRSSTNEIENSATKEPETRSTNKNKKKCNKEIIALSNGDGDEDTSNDSESIDDLRSVGKDYYDCLKYTYNFKFGEYPPIKESSVEGIKQLHLNSDILEFRISRNRPYLNKIPLPPHIKANYKNVLEQLCLTPVVQPKNCIIPPRWPLMVGWRALSIHHNDETETTDFKKIQKHEAVQKFRRRFRSLFYNSALACQVASPQIQDIPNSDDVQQLVTKKSDVVENNEIKRKNEKPGKSTAKQRRLESD